MSTMENLKQVRIPKPLCEKIKKVANKERRSLTNQIIIFCEDALERHESE